MMLYVPSATCMFCCTFFCWCPTYFAQTAFDPYVTGFNLCNSHHPQPCLLFGGIQVIV